MSEITNTESFNIIIYIIKTYFISIFTYYIALKSINPKITYSFFIIPIIMLIVSCMCGIIKYYFNFLYSIIFLGMILAIILSKSAKSDIVYSILIITFSLSINYIFLFIASTLTFVPNIIMKFKNNYINLIFIITFYSILIYLFSKIKRFKKGFSFLQKNLKNGYFDILILNISVIILFLIILLSNYNEIITNRILLGIIISSIMMFITIQKSLQLYYKQKLLVQELNETREELKNKKQEVKQLEKENLSFSKTSHSIAHRQRALEYKLNELIQKNEIAPEIDITDRIKKVSTEIRNKDVEIELSKTDIPEIDDMLKYMQSECIKNKIDFQLQINGNIHYMINNCVSKEKLEILLADHIKNAIIAINYSDNINKSILVRLGKIDGAYALYVYDSGIEFEVNTLLNLGKKPSTTHADNGGTGIGFMNTFDTLREYKASIIINEYNEPSKDNFTKVIIIKFDKNEETKICSYRYEAIKKERNDENITIEKISKIH